MPLRKIASFTGFTQPDEYSLRLAKDLSHQPNLCILIRGVVLINADGVDPQMGHLEITPGAVAEESVDIPAQC